jgi:hypothetical protein
MLGPTRCASPDPRTDANSVMGRREVEWRISDRPKEGAPSACRTPHTGQSKSRYGNKSQERQPVSLI